MLAAIFYCAATGFTKVSVLIFYLRIFPSKNFHFAVWSIVFIAVGYNIASVLANVFACTPIAKSWDLLITSGGCMNRSVFYFANAALGIFTDFATVLVPIPWLAKLQMPLRQKVAIGVILAMGCLYVPLSFPFLFLLLAETGVANNPLPIVLVSSVASVYQPSTSS